MRGRVEMTCSSWSSSKKQHDNRKVPPARWQWTINSFQVGLQGLQSQHTGCTAQDLQQGGKQAKDKRAACQGGIGPLGHQLQRPPALPSDSEACALQEATEGGTLKLLSHLSRAMKAAS